MEVNLFIQKKQQKKKEKFIKIFVYLLHIIQKKLKNKKN